MGFFDKLKAGLAKTKQLLQTDVRDLLKAGELLTEPQLIEFEKRLLRTDMGVAATDAILAELRAKHLGRTVVIDEIWLTVKDKLKSLLRGDGNSSWDDNNPLSPLKLSPTKPTVILVAGVNGAGKTTSIAKLAKLLMSTGNSVVLAAGDTFRAAAVEQLMNESLAGVPGPFISTYIFGWSVMPGRPPWMAGLAFFATTLFVLLALALARRSFAFHAPAQPA